MVTRKILILALLFLSSIQAQTARFTAVPNGKSVQFAYAGSNTATWYHWDFGDGTYSTARNPLHVYAQSGNYNVTLRVGQDRALLTKPVVVSVPVPPPPPPPPPPPGPHMPATVPMLPTATVDVSYSLPTGGTTYNVNSGGNLQTALTNAVPGDVIVIEAGATFTGNFTCNGKSGSGWIYIISSALANLPAGTRVTGAAVANMPKIQSPSDANLLPALTIDNSSKIRLAGLNLTTLYDTHSGGSPALQYGLLRVGENSGADRIIVDRCWIHGTAQGNVRDGIHVWNTTNFALIDSYIDDIHTVNGESHGMQIQTGGGPFLVRNNHIEAGSINLFIGDNTPIGGTAPTDLTIQRNNLFKSLTWNPSDPSYAGVHWLCKNIFEMKAATRLLFEGNTLTNSWVDNQYGGAILCNAWGSPLTDITIRRNYVRNFQAGIQSFAPAGYGNVVRWLCEDNVFYTEANINYLYQLNGNTGELVDLTMAHNTMLTNKAVDDVNHWGWIVFDGDSGQTDQVTRMTVRDNLAHHGLYGIIGNVVGGQLTAVQHYTTGYDFRNNGLLNVATGYSGLYGTQTDWGPFYQNSQASALFTNSAFTTLEHFRLQAGSPHIAQATDGGPLGARIDNILAAQGGVANLKVLLRQ